MTSIQNWADVDSSDDEESSEVNEVVAAPVVVAPVVSPATNNVAVSNARAEPLPTRAQEETSVPVEKDASKFILFAANLNFEIKAHELQKFLEDKGSSVIKVSLLKPEYPGTAEIQFKDKASLDLSFKLHGEEFAGRPIKMSTSLRNKTTERRDGAGRGADRGFGFGRRDAGRSDGVERSEGVDRRERRESDRPAGRGFNHDGYRSGRGGAESGDAGSRRDSERTGRGGVFGRRDGKFGRDDNNAFKSRKPVDAPGTVEDATNSRPATAPVSKPEQPRASIFGEGKPRDAFVHDVSGFRMTQQSY